MGRAKKEEPMWNKTNTATTKVAGTEQESFNPIFPERDQAANKPKRKKRPA